MGDTDNQQFGGTRRQILAAMGATAAVGAAGCVGDGGDGDEFVAAVGANPDTFDPTIIADAASNAVVGTLAYEGLLDLTFDLAEFRPALATDWERLDETTYRFELREGVTFHTGDEFVAEDVAFSIERMRGTTNDATVAWIEAVEILDDHEIEIRSMQPHAPALNDLSAVPILPHGADGVSETPEADDHRFDEESLGTGPFVLELFQPEDRVELGPFEDYWWDGAEHPGTAPWDRVVFRVIPEQVSQEEAMLAGELDMIDNAAPFDLEQWEDERPEVIVGDSVGFDFVSYPVGVSPFDNETFRRGLTRLIPRGEIIEAIFGGNAVELGGPISPGLSDFWDAEHERRLLSEFVGEDREEATALLETAFEEESIDRPFELTLITNVNRTRERWMEVIQQTLDDTEFFDAELDVRAFDDLVPFLLDPDGAAASTDIVGIGWTGGSDPDGHVDQILHSDNVVPDGFNWNLYENDSVDALIDEGQQTIDTAERRSVYHDLQEVLAEEVPEAFMWTGDAIDVVDPDAFESVDDWHPHPNASLRYTALYRPTVDVVAGPPEEA
ncbi:MAG: ABC transporter substrate-binding protein [Natronomonas sp.]